jgi:hypothetical protein
VPWNSVVHIRFKRNKAQTKIYKNKEYLNQLEAPPTEAPIADRRQRICLTTTSIHLKKRQHLIELSSKAVAVVGSQETKLYSQTRATQLSPTLEGMTLPYAKTG